jgi:NADPH:quinone reductase-like Zn-dependent oxidoreductase
MNSTMNRWEIPSLGLDKLALREVPRPDPKAGEIVVEVDAVSLSYRDAEVAENGMGNTLNFPFTPTSDMAGRVVAVGEGVTRFTIGDRLISAYVPGWTDGVPLSWTEAPTQGGPIPGMLTQYVVAPAEWFVRAPRTLSTAEASTLPVAALTAWMALIELGNLHAGQTVVVQGTSGVSLFAVQLAAAHGARVIVTSGSDEKIARAIALGANHGINRNTTPDRARGARTDWRARRRPHSGNDRRQQCGALLASRRARWTHFSHRLSGRGPAQLAHSFATCEPCIDCRHRRWPTTRARGPGARRRPVGYQAGH